MQHHFADLLDREGNYWTIIPNDQRFSFSVAHELEDRTLVKSLTISKQDENWRQIFECPNLEELTLSNPSQEQVQEIGKLVQLKRLRLSFFRAADISFISSLYNLEELVFEYVSGFSDLSPLQRLPALRSLHLENLRRVSSFDGLKGIAGLQYLYISGTLDWNQPISDFSFLEGLPSLDYFGLGFVSCKAGFPVLFPALGLKKLRRLSVGIATFHTKEYAFLNVALPHVVKGYVKNETCWRPYYYIDQNNIYFLGKGTRAMKPKASNAAAKKQAAVEQFEIYTREAEELLRNAWPALACPAGNAAN